jgi:hypothetical protein
MKCRFDAPSLFCFSFALNTVILFWKLLVFEFLLYTSQNFLCSISALRVNNTVFLPDALQLLILFVGTLTYLEPTMLLLITFYNGIFSVLKTLLLFYMNVYIYCIYIYRHICFWPLKVSMTAYIEFLLLSKLYKFLYFVSDRCFSFGYFIIYFWAVK